MRSAIGQPDDGIRVGQDLRHRVVVDVDFRLDEAGVQVFLDDQIEEGVDDPFALLLGDLADRLAFQAPVLLQDWSVDPHVVIPSAGVSGGGKFSPLVLDDFVMQLAPDRGIAVGPQFLFVG